MTVVLPEVALPAVRTPVLLTVTMDVLALAQVAVVVAAVPPTVVEVAPRDAKVSAGVLLAFRRTAAGLTVTF